MSRLFNPSTICVVLWLVVFSSCQRRSAVTYQVREKVIYATGLYADEATSTRSFELKPLAGGSAYAERRGKGHAGAFDHVDLPDDLANIDFSRLTKRSQYVDIFGPNQFPTTAWGDNGNFHSSYQIRQYELRNGEFYGVALFLHTMYDKTSGDVLVNEALVKELTSISD